MHDPDVFRFDPPEDSSQRPSSQGENRFVVPFAYEASTDIPQESFIGIRSEELLRWADTAEELDGSSTGWSTAGWASVGAAASFGVGALTVSSYALVLAVVAVFLVGGAALCFKAHLDLNRKSRKDADLLAQEIRRKVRPGTSPTGPRQDGLPPPADAST